MTVKHGNKPRHYESDRRKIEMAKLTYAERQRLPRGVFCIPEKAPGPGSYPAHDASHGANALTRIKISVRKGRAPASDAKRVYSCVCRKFRSQVPACGLGFEGWWRKRR